MSILLELYSSLKDVVNFFGIVLIFLLLIAASFKFGFPAVGIFLMFVLVVYLSYLYLGAHIGKMYRCLNHMKFAYFIPFARCPDRVAYKSFAPT